MSPWWPYISSMSIMAMAGLLTWSRLIGSPRSRVSPDGHRGHLLRHDQFGFRGGEHLVNADPVCDLNECRATVREGHHRKIGHDKINRTRRGQRQRARFDNLRL